MTSTIPASAPAAPIDLVPGDVYQRVCNFYAQHMQLLDDGAAEMWADAFTEDAVFAQNVKDQPWRGRAEIAARLRAGIDAGAARGVTRRHWFGMIAVRPGDAAGRYRARYYAMVLETPYGGTPAVLFSIVGDDVLEDRDGGIAISHRTIAHDGA
jgi:bifunctional aromatase (cyclase/dehydratase)